jgi:preprotein translocase subunit SecY
MSIFALGIMPYISASIVIQLLTAVVPRLEKISKEQGGQKRITQITRYSTVALAFFQGWGIGVWLHNEGLAIPESSFFFYCFTALTMCTGTCFIMWLGEQISQRGIGNGISMIITLGILASYPMYLDIAFKSLDAGSISAIAFLLLFVSLVVVSGLIIFMQQASRKIPVQHARRMVGRRMVQGGSNYIPLKINTAGVIPVIFSSALLSFPMMLLPMIGTSGGSLGDTLSNWLNMNSPHNLYNAVAGTVRAATGFDLGGGIFSVLKVVNLYTFLYIILTVFFCFFYTAITMNPIDMAENLRKSGAFIPGIKPGKATADFIDYTLVRITTVGSLFLVVVALVPELLHVSLGIDYGVAQIAGGTGLIIVVGVMLDTINQIDAQLMMRHQAGFLSNAGRGGAPGAGGAARRPRIRIGGSSGARAK